MQFLTDNTGIIIAAAVAVVFVIGLVLALRTERGRVALGNAAVRLAVAALGMAERWLGHLIYVAPDGEIAARGKGGAISTARDILVNYLDK